MSPATPPTARAACRPTPSCRRSTRNYIAKQLAEFKSGKRQNAIMAGMAAALSDEDMKHLAAFFGSKKPVAGAAGNKDTVRLGEQIYRGGIASKQVPACSGCHSPNGAGIPAQYPRLGGQHGEYTQAQLIAFRSGARANSVFISIVSEKTLSPTASRCIRSRYVSAAAACTEKTILFGIFDCPGSGKCIEEELSMTN